MNRQGLKKKYKVHAHPILCIGPISALALEFFIVLMKGMIIARPDPCSNIGSSQDQLYFTQATFAISASIIFDDRTW